MLKILIFLRIILFFLRKNNKFYFTEEFQVYKMAIGFSNPSYFTTSNFIEPNSILAFP